MLDERFLHLYFCQRLLMLQRGSSAIADLLLKICAIFYLTPRGFIDVCVMLTSFASNITREENKNFYGAKYQRPIQSDTPQPKCRFWPLS